MSSKWSIYSAAGRLQMAQTFVADGRLDRPEQIFDLTIADIDQARSRTGARSARAGAGTHRA